jgi:hypothetical protein
MCAVLIKVRVTERDPAAGYLDGGQRQEGDSGGGVGLVVAVSRSVRILGLKAGDRWEGENSRCLSLDLPHDHVRCVQELVLI